LVGEPQRGETLAVAEPFEIKLRRQPGERARFAVRFISRRGRGLLTLEDETIVAESGLRSNGFLSDLDAEQVLSGIFIYVGDSVEQNGKFLLWDGDPDELGSLAVGAWCDVRPLRAQQNPFFMLDTDNMDFHRHWREGPPEAWGEGEVATDPSALGQRCFFEEEIPPAAPPPENTFTGVVARLRDEAQETGGDDDWAEIELPDPEESVTALSASERGRLEELQDEVGYLREQLYRERLRRSELEEEVTRLVIKIEALGGKA